MANFNSGIYKSVNGGLNWQSVNSGLVTTQSRNVFQLLLTGNNLYAAAMDGIYKSTNAGISWEKKSSGIIIGGGSTFEYCNSIYELNGNLFTGAYTAIYRSTNGGESWIPANITGSAVLAKNFTYHNGILFAARESINTPYAYKSTDNGLNWSTAIGINYPTITFFSETGKIWAGTIHGAWLSTSDGTSWSNRSSGLPPDPYNSGFVRVNGVLISSVKFGGSGIFKTTNDGLNWIEISEGLPFLSSIEKLYVYNGKILAVTSAGLYQRNINEIITGIEPQAGNTPQSFALYQNYPNPFNPKTMIKFSIPSNVKSEMSNVKLIIFDVLGREIIILVNESLNPGEYEVEWDASNYPSGVYYYKLTSGNYFETRKMILIK